MRPIRMLGWLAGAAIAAGVVAPVAVLVLAALVDRGPAGSVRDTLLYVALAVFDPFVWTCVGHSVMAALAVALGSGCIGVSLARVVGRWRFWARRPLALLVWLPLAVPPVVAALGVRGLLDHAAPWPGAGFNALPWLAWIWVGLACGVPVVALAARAGLERVDPAWEDAARQAGASRRWVWWTIAWPIVRPETGRAMAAVFTLTLLEPGAPLVLSLRRTLGFQVVQAVLAGPAQAPRAAILSLAALAISGFARLLVLWWARSPWPTPPAAPHPFPPRAGWLRSLAMCGLLAGWAAVGLVPALRVVATASAPEAHEAEPTAGLWTRLQHDPAAPRLVGNALVLGASAAGLGLLLAWVLVATAPPQPGRWARWRRLAASLPEACPPLALGVGFVLIPALLGTAAESGLLGEPASHGLAARAVRRAADLLDPYRAPGLLVVAALTMIHLPTLARAAFLGQARVRPIQLDAARACGASGLRARRSALRLWLGGTPGAAFLLVTALAATSLAPAVVLLPTSEGEPLALAVLRLADEPAGLPRACLFATAAMALNLVAWTLAASRRATPLGHWFRG